jgi:AsmA-like protein
MARPSSSGRAVARPHWTLKKPLAMALGAAAALLALVYGAVFWIESESGQRFIERHASSATGREVKIGELDIKVGWRPGVRVSGLRVSNPQWAKTPALIDAALVDARFRLMPLVLGRAIIEDLTLVQAKAGLEREENRNTWSVRERPQDQQSGLRGYSSDVSTSTAALSYIAIPRYRRTWRSTWPVTLERAGHWTSAWPENTGRGTHSRRAAHTRHPCRDVGSRDSRRHNGCCSEHATRS